MASRGALPPNVPWLVVVVELGIAAVVFVLGWQVRQYLQGKRPDLDALRAARTVVLAKASCYTGALLAGWYGGHVLTLLTGTDEPGTGGRRALGGDRDGRWRRARGGRSGGRAVLPDPAAGGRCRLGARASGAGPDQRRDGRREPSRAVTGWAP